MELFPYPPRPFQRDLVAFLREALVEGGHAAAESGTGTGKTVCALVAALEVARERGKRVLYLTRTNSQERQVVVELRAIRKRSGLPLKAVALQGRRHLCPLAEEDGEVGRANAEELGVMCRDRMKAVDDEAAGRRTRVTPCRFYRNTLMGPAADETTAWAREALPTAEDLVAKAREQALCPYAITRRLLPDASVVVAPYVYFFHPFLRMPFLQWIGAAVEDLVVVVDEAHNLPEFAREVASADLGQRTLELALTEADEFGNPTVLGERPLKSFLARLQTLLSEIARDHVPEGEEDALVPPDELDAALLSAFTCTTPALDRALALLGEYGEAVREARRRAARVPRSYVGAVATFLQFYRRADDETHVRLILGGEEPRLQCYAVDPSVVTGVLRESAGSLHLSGTLRPLDAYCATIGLPEARRREFPSPFPPENRLALFDPAVTTRYEDVRRDPTHWDEIGARLRAIREATDRNVAVFLPSYEALHRLARHVEGAREVVREVQGAKQSELMDAVARFKATRGGTLLSVVGGRIAEGMDFPDAELEVVVIVGLPYGRPTARQAALIRFHDRRHGRGWAYAVQAPMIRKVLQAVGRLIRTPTDRGVAILLDRRAALLRGEIEELVASRDVAADLAQFFSRDPAPPALKGAVFYNGNEVPR